MVLGVGFVNWKSGPKEAEPSDESGEIRSDHKGRKQITINRRPSEDVSLTPITAMDLIISLFLNNFFF